MPGTIYNFNQTNLLNSKYGKLLYQFVTRYCHINCTVLQTRPIPYLTYYNCHNKSTNSIWKNSSSETRKGIPLEKWSKYGLRNV